MYTYIVTYCFSKSIIVQQAGLLVLCLLCFSVQAQDKSHDTFIYQTIVTTAGKDMDKALEMGDSLYKVSRIPLDKVKSLMLLAQLNLDIGRKKEAVNFAFAAEKVTIENGLYEWQARVNGFIATHYRSIGLKKQSKIYLTRGLEAIKKVKDDHIVNQYKGLIFQELALYEIEIKNYTKAIAYLKAAAPCFKHIRNEDLRHYQFATNHGQLGRAYMYLKDTELAITHFKTALDYLSKIKNETTVVKGFVYEGLGRAYLEDHNPEAAITYLRKAYDIAEHSKDLDLQLEVYCDLAIYHLEAGNVKEYKMFNGLYLTLLDKSIDINQSSSEQVVNRLQQREEELSLRHTLAWIAFCTIVALLLGVLIYNRIKRKKDYQRFQEILHRLDNPDKELAIESSIAQQYREVPDKELLSKEAENAILNKLKDFEASQGFISKGISLSQLSVTLETNSKYLSYVINKHKKKDFNNYINELRIFYIIKKLESSPEYLNYKISYLAEECGFSSHSKFTDKFKAVAGMSPSTFIGFLTKETKGNVA